MKVVVCDASAARRVALLRSRLRTAWEIHAVEADDRERLAAVIPDADALIANEFWAGLGSVARRLKLVHCVGAGVDLMETSAFPPGCALCNVYEHEGPIAEYVMLGVLMFATRITRWDRAFREGRWDGSGRVHGEFHEEVAGKTLGLVGFGHIGRQAARRARAFGMRVIAVRRNAGADADLDWCGANEDLGRLMSESDYVAVVCPLTEETRGMIGAGELGRMKPTAVLINPARGEIVDEAALFAALRGKRIAGAALDAWYRYPARLSEVLHGSALPFHELENVVVTPHFSGWTEAMLNRRYDRIAANLDRLALGEPLERVVYRAPA